MAPFVSILVFLEQILKQILLQGKLKPVFEFDKPNLKQVRFMLSSSRSTSFYLLEDTSSYEKVTFDFLRDINMCFKWTELQNLFLICIKSWI